MRIMVRTLAAEVRRLGDDRSAASASEYAILLGLISLAMVAAMSGFAGAVGGLFSTATTAFGG